MQGVDTFEVNEWLSRAVQLNASDVHFHSGYPPMFRLNGSVTALAPEVIADAELVSQLQSMLTESQKQTFRDKKSVDFTYDIASVGRFRASMFLGNLALTPVSVSFRLSRRLWKNSACLRSFSASPSSITALC